MAGSAIALIQWLGPNEYRETRAALSKFASEVNIYHADVKTATEAREAVGTWLSKSAGNAQYCFIGAHGNSTSLGASANPGEFVEWQELWDWFSNDELRGGLWLGACKSSTAALALSPFLSSQSRGPAIPYFYGFSDEIYPLEIQQILLKLLEFTGLENFPFLDEELAQLRAAVMNTKVQLYYPAQTRSGLREYVSVDEMPQKVGVLFRQLLEKVGSP